MEAMKNKTHEPVAIANYFIEKSGGQGLTLMQILKLSYIAHGFKLGLEMGELSCELAEAWKYGPVFPSIYYGFKREPPGRIKTLGTENDEITPVRTNFSEKERNVLDLVDEIYSPVEGWRLSKLTHEEGTPWHKAYYEGGGEEFRGISIKNEDIKTHFKNTVIQKYDIKI